MSGWSRDAIRHGCCESFLRKVNKLLPRSSFMPVSRKAVKEQNRYVPRPSGMFLPTEKGQFLLYTCLYLWRKFCEENYYRILVFVRFVVS